MRFSIKKKKKKKEKKKKKKKKKLKEVQSVIRQPLAWKKETCILS